MLKFCCALLLSLVVTKTNAQETYAEKLGFPKGKKVIILHVDDAGMSYDSNVGTLKSLNDGVATSTSVMMPCAWVPQFFDWYKQNPKWDVGVHLTLTSEWNNYRWAPLAGRDKVPGLLDEQGAFYHNVAQVEAHASPEELEAECRAQIARFRQFNIEPTHIDSHMGTLFRPKYIQTYVKVGISEKIPVMFPAGSLTLIGQGRSEMEKGLLRQLGQQLWNAGLPVLDDLHADSYGWNLPKDVPVTDENLRKMKTEKYIDIIQQCQPGLTMIIMHSTDPTEVFKQISDSAPTRKGDMLAMLDPKLRNFIEKEGIILTTFREIKERRGKVK
ncbi:MAG: polysaccharide deacetylase family protein [Spirosomataceae bacterium]